MTANPISAVIFDLDDTLVHTIPYYVQVNQTVYKTIAEAGLDITDIDQVFEEIERNAVAQHLYAAHRFPRSLRLLYEHMCVLQDKVVNHHVGHRIEGMGWDLYDTLHPLTDGAIDILSYLKDKGVRVICFTKGDQQVQSNKLIRSGLMGYFEAVEVTDDKTPGAFLQLALKYQLIPSETLMVGDSVYSDINPAGKAGYQPVWIPCTHGTWAVEAVQPSVEYRTITALADLKQIVT